MHEVPTRVEVMRVAVKEYMVWVNLSHRLGPLIALFDNEPLLKLHEIDYDRIPQDVFVVSTLLKHWDLYVTKLTDVVERLSCIWILHRPLGLLA